MTDGKGWKSYGIVRSEKCKKDGVTKNANEERIHTERKR